MNPPLLPPGKKSFIQAGHMKESVTYLIIKKSTWLSVAVSSSSFHIAGLRLYPTEQLSCHLPISHSLSGASLLFLSVPKISLLLGRRGKAISLYFSLMFFVNTCGHLIFSTWGSNSWQDFEFGLWTNKVLVGPRQFYVLEFGGHT